MIIKCSKIFGNFEILSDNKQIARMCKTKTVNREDIIVNNAANSNSNNNGTNIFSEFQIIGITLITGMILYILYQYLKNKFTKKVTQAIERQAPL